MAYGNETTPKPRSITKAYNTPNIHVPKQILTSHADQIQQPEIQPLVKELAQVDISYV